MPLHRCCKVVAFDTNVLVAVERKKADVFSMARRLFGKSVRFVVTEQVKEELCQLGERGKSMERSVKVAKEVLKKEDVKVIGIKARDADASLLEAAKQGFCVATNDRRLRKRIKKLGGAIIYLRGNRLLESG